MFVVVIIVKKKNIHLENLKVILKSFKALTTFNDKDDNGRSGNDL